jgi:uncharacterized membrane protein YqgA involved in biofilm formation
MPRTYHVKAIWDVDSKLWISESDIEGLHIEAATLDEFEAILNDVGGELVAANHVSDMDLERFKARDLIPAIVFVRPEPEAA